LVRDGDLLGDKKIPRLNPAGFPKASSRKSSY